MRPEERTWYYFGCVDSVGHRLVDRNRRSHYHDELINLDGQLCTEDTALYRAVLTRLPHLNYSALAWWDQTVDRRPGSNSIIFAPSVECTLESIRTAMTRWFPWVEARLPKPLIVLNPNQ